MVLFICLFLSIFLDYWAFAGSGRRTKVSLDDVSFYLHTRNSEITVLDENNLASVVPKPVKFMVHGFTDNGNMSWIINMTDVLLEKYDVNIIAVDWHEPASSDYITAAKNTRIVGNIIGEFIVKLRKKQKINLNTCHLIGHSLGAHVMGFAGKQVYTLTGKKVKQITGLDPARPYFEKPEIPKTDRLSNEDAEIVECIHTDGGVYGFKAPLCTIDFFANGGIPVQPNCSAIIIKSNCSHQKAHVYYTYAITKNGLPATKCDSYESFKDNACKGNRKAALAGNLSANDNGNYYVDIAF